MSSNTEQNKLVDTRDFVHPGCTVCSLANPKGMHMDFEINDEGHAQAEFDCDKCYEGYPGMVHGGVISSILDGAMGNCMFAHGLATVTIEMKVKFRTPLQIGKQAKVWAKVTRVSHPLYVLEAEIIQDGKVAATAKGKYYDQPHLMKLIG